ncbi:diguanylate phosphodiesterase [Pseudomonas sp. SMT-1]|nr:diguanylate phosphodiesterase [Pseudomonas sp. SMT-1]
MAATVNGGWKLASRAGPFAGKPAPTRGLRLITNMCPPPIGCRSGFTREYGSGGNGERRVEIGQQARPFRG